MNEFEEIINAVLNFEFKLTVPCEYYFNAKYSKDSIPEGLNAPEIPPFDTLPCYPKVQGGEERVIQFSKKNCIRIVFDLELATEFDFVQKVSWERAQIFLVGEGVSFFDEVLFSNLDLVKSGINVIDRNADWEPSFSVTYQFSKIYLNEMSDKAILFLKINNSGENSMFYLKKVGQKWYLLAKEII